MTWKQLKTEIDLLSQEQQSQDVTVYVRGVDEFYPVTDKLLFTSEDECDVLDHNSPYLEV